MSKVNQTWYGVSPGYVECKTKRIFAIAFLGKKLVFHTELFEFLEKGILKIGLFYRIEKLLKSNQNWYGLSPWYVKRKTERFFGIAWLGKKLAFHTEISYYFRKILNK